MLDLRRHTAIAVVFGCLALLYGTLDGIAMLALGWAPRALWGGDAPVDVTWLERAAGRGIAARRAVDAGGRNKQELVVVAGQSTVREGIQSALVEAADPGDRRWLVVGGSGASTSALRDLIYPIATLALRPRAVVLGIHYGWFSGHKRALPTMRDQATQIRTTAQTRGPVVAARITFGLTWLGHNARPVGEYIHRTLTFARLAIMRDLNVPLQAIYVPADDPWSLQSMYDDQFAGREFLDVQLQRWTARGWFSERSYQPNGKAVRALRDTIALLEEHTHVIVVLMPEHSELRARIPRQAAAKTLGSALEVPAEQAAIPVVDMRDAIPDEHFRDLAHLNTRGRELFSALLGQRMAGILGM
jgi:hypothetical protein